MIENAKTIKIICDTCGMGQTALSRRFGIPLRTVQDWYSGRSNPPAYVVNMIADLLESEKNSIYLIYKDDIDDACEIAGYIHGTEEAADRYCDELNKGHKYEYEDYTWIRLRNLLEDENKENAKE